MPEVMGIRWVTGDFYVGGGGVEEVRGRVEEEVGGGVGGRLRFMPIYY